MPDRSQAAYAYHIYIGEYWAHALLRWWSNTAAATAATTYTRPPTRLRSVCARGYVCFMNIITRRIYIVEERDDIEWSNGRVRARAFSLCDSDMFIFVSDKRARADPRPEWLSVHAVCTRCSRNERCLIALRTDALRTGRPVLDFRWPVCVYWALQRNSHVCVWRMWLRGIERCSWPNASRVCLTVCTQIICFPDKCMDKLMVSSVLRKFKNYHTIIIITAIKSMKIIENNCFYI